MIGNQFLVVEIVIETGTRVKIGPIQIQGRFVV